jgi:cytosine/creatinine deaminase
MYLDRRIFDSYVHEIWLPFIESKRKMVHFMSNALSFRSLTVARPSSVWDNQTVQEMHNKNNGAMPMKQYMKALAYHLKPGKIKNLTSVVANFRDQALLKRAYQEAKKSFDESGLPIGAVLAGPDGIVSVGHNRRVQDGDPIAHGEMDCLRRAGRRRRYDELTLYTTLSPCIMCSGAVLQFGIRRLVVGENRNFHGNIDFLRSRGVHVILVDDSDCVELMKRYIAENPATWDEDIAGNDSS